MSIMMLLYLFCGITYLAIGIYTYTQNKKRKLNIVFLMVCVNLFILSFLLALMSATNNPVAATKYRVLTSYAWSFIFAFMQLFYIILTGVWKDKKGILRYILLFVPAIISVRLYVFDPVSVQHIVRVSTGWAFINPTDKGLLWDMYLNVYYISYLTISCLLLTRWIYTSKLKRVKMQGKVMVATILIAFILSFTLDIVLPIFQIRLIPPLAVFFVSVVIGGVGYSMNRYGLMIITKEKIVSDVFEIMHDGLIILNHKNCIESINKGALDFLGYREEALLNQPAKHLFSEEDYEKILGNSSSNELMMYCGDGSKIAVLLSSSYIVDRFEEPIGNLIIFQDLSYIKTIQLELKKSYEDLEWRVEQRTLELSRVNAKLGTEIVKRIEKEKEIENLAYNDHLTGLPNRRSFQLHLEECLVTASRNQQIFAVLFLDLDGFKNINDTLGHDQGDRLLVELSKRIKHLVRKDDYVARVGGDEFIIIVSNLTDESNIVTICNNISSEFKKPIHLEGGECSVSVSIGIALYPEHGHDSKTLVRNADISMYKAKESSLENHFFYDPSILSE